jgi:hypothetical protein
MPLPQNTAVVLLPGTHARALLEIAQEWTASWLLTPAAYVDLSAVHVDAGDPNRAPLVVPCQVVGRNGVSNLDLFRALGRYESDVLRVVAVRLVDESAEDTAEQQRLMGAVRDTLARAGRSSLRLVSVNLVVAHTNQGSADPGHLLQPGWTANVIASPEDRQSVRAFDGFTRASEPDRFRTFMLSHAAAAAGLWAGSAAGPYDIEDATSSSKVILQRVAVRGVFADGLLVDVATAGARRLTDAALMSDRLITANAIPLKPLAAAAVGPAVGQLVEDSLTLDGEALRYHPVSDATPVQARRVGLGRQLHEFATFAWDALRSIPASVAEGVVRGVSREVTGALHGPSGEAEVVVESWMPALSHDLKSMSERLEAQQAASRAELEAPLPHAREDLHPALWSSLRQLSFAALDGSSMPQGVRPLGQTAPQAEVLPEIGSLVPDMQDTWEPWRSGVTVEPSRFDLAGPEARWYDETSILEWSTRLAVASSEAEARASTTREVAQALRTELETLEQEWAQLDEVATRASDEAALLRADLEDMSVEPGEASSEETQESRGAGETTPTAQPKNPKDAPGTPEPKEAD